MKTAITVVGSINMDLITYTSRIPSIGETILGTSFKMNPGGKGANQAVAAAKLGVGVCMIGKIGKDDFSKELIENLSRNKVVTKNIKKDQSSFSGIASIIVDGSGDNCIIVSPGANMNLLPEDVEESRSAIINSGALLMQLEIPLDTVIKAAEIAHANNVLTVLNPAPAQKLPASLLSNLDVIIPNESEIQILTDMTVNTLEEVEKASRFLVDLGVRLVVVTLGSRGALLTSKDQTIFSPAFNVDVVDTVAAGDSFVSSFTYALSINKPLDEALRWGNAAGALATTGYGSQTSLPDIKGIEDLLAHNSNDG